MTDLTQGSLQRHLWVMAVPMMIRHVCAVVVLFCRFVFCFRLGCGSCRGSECWREFNVVNHGTNADALMSVVSR